MSKRRPYSSNQGPVTTKRFKSFGVSGAPHKRSGQPDFFSPPGAPGGMLPTDLPGHEVGIDSATAGFKTNASLSLNIRARAVTAKFEREIPRYSYVVMNSEVGPDTATGYLTADVQQLSLQSAHALFHQLAVEFGQDVVDPEWINDRWKLMGIMRTAVEDPGYSNGTRFTNVITAGDEFCRNIFGGRAVGNMFVFMILKMKKISKTETYVIGTNGDSRDVPNKDSKNQPIDYVVRYEPLITKNKWPTMKERRYQVIPKGGTIPENHYGIVIPMGSVHNNDKVISSVDAHDMYTRHLEAMTDIVKFQSLDQIDMHLNVRNP
ncbi:MAG: hypothetical protein ACTSUE_05130 [Promethearchaeota archaeon]